MALIHIEGSYKEEDIVFHDPWWWDKKEFILNYGKLRLYMKVWEEAKAETPKPPPFSNSRDTLNNLSSDRISITESCKEMKQT